MNFEIELNIKDFARLQGSHCELKRTTSCEKVPSLAYKVTFSFLFLRFGSFLVHLGLLDLDNSLD